MTTTLRSSPALRAAHSSRRRELYLVTPAKNNSSGYLLWCSNFLRVFTARSINFEISAASPGVKAPSETASRIAALAATASAGRSILGRSKETGRSRRTGAILSRMIFAAVISPNTLGWIRWSFKPAVEGTYKLAKRVVVPTICRSGLSHKKASLILFQAGNLLK